MSDEQRIPVGVEQRIEVSPERAELLRGLLLLSQGLSDGDLLFLLTEIATGKAPQIRPSELMRDLSTVTQAWETAAAEIRGGADVATAWQRARAAIERAGSPHSEI